MAVTEKVAAWPAETDLLAGCALIEGATPVPVAVIAMVTEAFEAVLATSKEPVDGPTEEALKVTLSEVLCPGLSDMGNVKLPRLYPLPEVVICVMRIAADPEFERLAVSVLVFPTVTFPKPIELGADNWPAPLELEDDPEEDEEPDEEDEAPPKNIPLA